MTANSGAARRGGRPCRRGPSSYRIAPPGNLPRSQLRFRRNAICSIRARNPVQAISHRTLLVRVRLSNGDRAFAPNCFRGEDFWRTSSTEREMAIDGKLRGTGSRARGPGHARRRAHRDLIFATMSTSPILAYSLVLCNAIASYLNRAPTGGIHEQGFCCNTRVTGCFLHRVDDRYACARLGRLRSERSSRQVGPLRIRRSKSSVVFETYGPSGRSRPEWRDDLLQVRTWPRAAETQRAVFRQAQALRQAQDELSCASRASMHERPPTVAAVVERLPGSATPATRLPFRMRAGEGNHPTCRAHGR